MTATTDLRTFLEGYGVLSEVIDDLASNRGLSTFTEFVNAIDSKEEAKDAFFEGGPHVKNLGQIGNIGRACRDAAEKEDKEHEAKAKVTSQTGCGARTSMSRKPRTSRPTWSRTSLTRTAGSTWQRTRWPATLYSDGCVESSFGNSPRFFQFHEFVLEQTHLTPRQRRRMKCVSTRAFLTTRMTMHWKNVRRRFCWSYSGSSACSVCLGLSRALTRSNGTANRSGTHTGARRKSTLPPETYAVFLEGSDYF